MIEAWPVNPIDVGVLLVLLVSGILAFFRGFVHEVLNIAAWIGAILAAVYGIPALSPWFMDVIPDVKWLPDRALAADIAAGAALFVVTLLILSIVAAIIGKQVQKSALNTLDRSLGFVFGLLRGMVFVVVGYAAMSWLLPPDRQPTWMRQAKSMPMIERGTTAAMAMLPEELRVRERSLRQGATEAKDKAETLMDTARQAQEAQETFERLNNPQPRAATPESTDPGYTSGERDDLNRVIQQNTQ